MRPIPPNLKLILNGDPFMSVCIHNNADCEDEFGNKPGRVEFEHAFIYAGRQVNEWWALVPVDWYHHRGPGLDKSYNQYIALSRLDDIQLFEVQRKYPRIDWFKWKKELTKKHGKS